MHRAQPAEREPRHAAQEFGIMKLNRDENTDEREDGEPD